MLNYALSNIVLQLVFFNHPVGHKKPSIENESELWCLNCSEG